MTTRVPFPKQYAAAPAERPPRRKGCVLSLLGLVRRSGRYLARGAIAKVRIRLFPWFPNPQYDARNHHKPGAFSPRDATPRTLGSSLMRVFFGIILGVALTVSVAFISDTF